MATEAPISKYNLRTLKIYIIVCVGVGIALAYDGYLSKYEWSRRHDFYQEHVIDNGGEPDSSMMFNRYLPPLLVVGAIFFATRLSMIKNKKVIADDTSLIIGPKTITYDSIEKINKTYFKSKGYFIVTYKDQQGTDTDVKISDKTYDNLEPLLDEIVTKIS